MVLLRFKVVCECGIKCFCNVQLCISKATSLIARVLPICIGYGIFGSVWVAALIRFPAGWILSFAAANSPHHIAATCRSSLDQIRFSRDIRLWKSNWVRIAPPLAIRSSMIRIPLNNCSLILKLSGTLYMINSPRYKPKTSHMDIFKKKTRTFSFF